MEKSLLRLLLVYVFAYFGMYAFSSLRFKTVLKEERSRGLLPSLLILFSDNNLQQALWFPFYVSC